MGSMPPVMDTARRIDSGLTAGTEYTATNSSRYVVQVVRQTGTEAPTDWGNALSVQPWESATFVPGAGRSYWARTASGQTVTLAITPTAELRPGASAASVSDGGGGGQVRVLFYTTDGAPPLNTTGINGDLAFVRHSGNDTLESIYLKQDGSWSKVADVAGAAESTEAQIAAATDGNSRVSPRRAKLAVETFAEGAVPHIPVIDHELGTFTFPSSGDPNNLSRGQLVFVNSNNAAQRLLYIRPESGADEFIGFHWKVGFAVTVGGAAIVLASHTLPPTQLSNGTYRAHYTITAGSIPAQGATGIVVRVPGDVPAEEDLATVAKTGSYTDLLNKPNISGASESTTAQIKAGTDAASRVSPRRAKEAVQAFASGAVPQSIKFASALSSNPPSEQGGELVMYTAGTPSDTTDTAQNVPLNTVVTMRMSYKHAMPDLNLGSPSTDVDAVDVEPFIDSVIARKGALTVLLTGITANSNPDLATDTVVYVTGITKGGTVGDQSDPPYIQLAGLTWGPTNTRTPDQGSVSINFEMRLAAPVPAGEVYGLLEAVAVPAKATQAESDAGTNDSKFVTPLKAKTSRDKAIEQARIDEFISDPETLRIDNYTNLDANQNTFTGANGQALFTEGTGAPPVDLYFAVAYNDSAGTNRKEALSLQAGDEFLVHETAGGNYVFGTVVSQIALQDSDNNDSAWRWTYKLDASRGLQSYSTLPHGAIRIHIREGLNRTFAERDLNNVETLASAGKTRLRTDLPTGTSETDGTLAATDRLLLKNFDDITVEDFVTHHDESHTGIVTISGLTFTTGGVSNQASDRGKIAWAGANLTTNPLSDTVKASLLASVIGGRRVTLRVDASNYRTGIASATLTDSGGLLTLSLTDSATTGTIANGASVSLEVESNIAARDELTEAAFKADAGSAGDYARSTGTDVTMQTPRSTVRATGSTGTELVSETGIRAAISSGGGGSAPTLAVSLNFGQSNSQSWQTLSPSFAAGDLLAVHVARRPGSNSYATVYGFTIRFSDIPLANASGIRDLRIGGRSEQLIRRSSSDTTKLQFFFGYSGSSNSGTVRVYKLGTIA